MSRLRSSPQVNARSCSLAFVSDAWSAAVPPHVVAPPLSHGNSGIVALKVPVFPARFLQSSNTFVSRSNTPFTPLLRAPQPVHKPSILIPTISPVRSRPASALVQVRHVMAATHCGRSLLCTPCPPSPTTCRYQVTNCNISADHAHRRRRILPPLHRETAGHFSPAPHARSIFL